MIGTGRHNWFYGSGIINYSLQATQPAFTCQRQQQKQKVNMWNVLKVNNKDTRTTLIMSFLVYCQRWTDFTHLSAVSIVAFEQVNAGWLTLHSISAKITILKTLKWVDVISVLPILLELFYSYWEYILLVNLRLWSNFCLSMILQESS